MKRFAERQWNRDGLGNPAWLPPLAAFAAARVWLALAARRAGASALDPASYCHWDSGHYLSIATSGYRLVGCERSEGWSPAFGLACGNAGWFPLYPWLLRHTPAPAPLAGVVLSALAHLALLTLLWRGLRGSRAAWPALAVAAFFPGVVYFSAVFPVSLTALLGTLAIEAAVRSRPFAAALAAGASALAYANGLVSGLAIAAADVLRGRWRSPRPWVVGLGTIAGYLGALAWIGIATGQWDAYVRVQAKYDFHVAPIDWYFARLKPIVNARFRTGYGFAGGVQTLVSTALIAAAWATRPWKRDERERFAIGAATLAFVVPIAMGHRGLHRTEALAVPLVWCLGAARPAVVWGLAVLAAAAAWLASVEYFRGTLG